MDAGLYVSRLRADVSTCQMALYNRGKVGTVHIGHLSDGDVLTIRLLRPTMTLNK